MEKVKKYFGEFEMTWPRVIIFAVLTAVLTAVLNLIPALYDTSFQDIAISYECWILFAVFIIVNCDKWWEASLKTFVFFLISQPLIYLIEVPFNDMGWQLFGYYRFWFILTLLTLPGAVAAFQLKRKAWLSVAVLSVATVFLTCMSVDYFYTAIAIFPHHLLSAVFCLALAIFFVFVLLDEKKHRLVALALIVAALIFSIFYLKPVKTQELVLDEGEWTCTVKDDSVVTAEMTDANRASIHAEGEGNTIITFENADGTISEYCATVFKGGILVDLID